MGGNWYCVIFGEEFGPISWDDLVALAAHGTLGKHERVKQGADAEWVAAESVPALFSSAATAIPSAAASQAGEIDAADDTDFEISGQPAHSPPEAEPADDLEFDICAPVSAGSHEKSRAEASSAETDFDLGVPAAPSSVELAPEVEEPADTDFDTGVSSPTRSEIAPAPPGDKSSGASGPVAVTSEDIAAAAPQPDQAHNERSAGDVGSKKPKTKASGVTKEQTRRALVFILSAMGAVGSAYLVYMGMVTLAAMRRPDYKQILTGYDQLFQQAQAAQGDNSVLANPQATMAFVAALKTLRAGLKEDAPDTTDAQLAEAGTLLAQLFATAAAPPGSETAQERKVAETAYLAKMSAVRSKLGE
jgi:hypothetical protein